MDPDQTPRSAASDLGLHCLPMSLLWDARLALREINTHGKATLSKLFCLLSEKRSTLKGKFAPL